MPLGWTNCVCVCSWGGTLTECRRAAQKCPPRAPHPHANRPRSYGWLSTHDSRSEIQVSDCAMLAQNAQEEMIATMHAARQGWRRGREKESERGAGGEIDVRPPRGAATNVVPGGKGSKAGLTNQTHYTLNHANTCSHRLASTCRVRVVCRRDTRRRTCTLSSSARKIEGVGCPAYAIEYRALYC